jgi:hypothetical protein
MLHFIIKTSINGLKGRYFFKLLGCFFSYIICVQSKYNFYSHTDANFVTLGGANYSAIAPPLSYINTRVSAERKFLNGILVKVSGHKIASSQI